MPHVDISVIGNVGCCPNRTELADGFCLKVKFRLGGFDVKTHAGREITAISRWIGVAVPFVKMIKINFGVNAPS